MPQPVTCSACGSTDLDDLSVVLAGGDENFRGGGLRVLIYCSRRCLMHPELTAPCAKSIKLALVDEQALLQWYANDRTWTTSSPEISSELVFGEARPEFIAKATKILEERAAKEAQ